MRLWNFAKNANYLWCRFRYLTDLAFLEEKYGNQEYCNSVQGGVHGCNDEVCQWKGGGFIDGFAYPKDLQIWEDNLCYACPEVL